MIQQKIKKYNAARQAVDRWSEEIALDLKPIFLRYQELWCPKDYARFPDDISSITVYDGLVRIAGSSSYRGCSSREWCTIPVEIAFASIEKREDMFREKHERNVAERLERDRMAEQREREQYEILRAKFEDVK